MQNRKASVKSNDPCSASGNAWKLTEGVALRRHETIKACKSRGTSWRNAKSGNGFPQGLNWGDPPVTTSSDNAFPRMAPQARPTALRMGSSTVRRS
jgi:hypothetical protein